MSDLIMHRFTGAEAFADAAFAYLERDEAAHNIFFGVTGDIVEYPRRYPGDNYFATVEEGAEIQMALMQTPPHNLILSRSVSDEAIRRAALEVADSGRELPGILSSPTEAEVFIEAYRQACGVNMGVASRQRIYQARRVEPPNGVAGAFRRAEHGDLDVLVDWVVSFEREAMGNDGGELRGQIANKVGDMVRAEAVGVWMVDGAAVSMAAAIGPTPNGIRVAYVYTPPARRRNGYASACVAELSLAEFEEGRDFCFLFTDLDNPTSNHIYQAIGYEPVCDMNVYEVQT